MSEGYVLHMTEHTTPSNATRAAEQAAAGKAHEAGAAATDEESRLADSNKVSPGVAEHEKDMQEKGANQKGEGRV